MANLKNKMPDFVAYMFLGIVLGIASKYLDNIGVVDNNWWMNILQYFGQLFSRLGIWVLIATFIAANSKTLIRAGVNTFIFFIGMLVSYYMYSAYLFGFFPTRYFIFWGCVALASPFFAAIVWWSRNSWRSAFILPALPMGLMLSLSLGMGMFYMYLNHIEELIMFVVLCVVFYKKPKQIVISVVFSFVLAFIFKQISPFHF
ncbi:hypothetical protein ACQKL5_13745 [Peribacillus sp. NPDC097675]|uniref:hypothetical protein n=1 Tax=Peribacillus sp. NPDC097675 TaxID=3390618 RepID=UPI003CFDB1EA